MTKQKKPRIRPLALCVFLRDGHIFVAAGYDAIKQQEFYRPIGGGIEFGEKAADAVAREVMEEIQAEVADLRYLATFENIFTYDGETGHEIVMLFDGRFVDATMNDNAYHVQGTDDGETLYLGSWKPLDFFRGDAAPPLYPDGLLDLLERLV